MVWTLNDMPDHRSVNGVSVPLTDAEKVALVNEWNANDAAKPLQEWNAEAARLDGVLVSLASLSRVIEDIATTGTISQDRKDLLAPVIAERVKHRAVKPA